MLTVPDERSLLVMRDRLHNCGIKYKVFAEADMDNEWTALATEPLNEPDRCLFKGLPLLDPSTERRAA